MNRLGYIIVATLGLLVIAALAALHFAARSLEDSIRNALGPQGEAAEITVRLTSIELVDVRIAAPKGWPAESTLRAKRIVVTPDVRHLISDHIEITRLHIEGAYLSAVRPKEGGGLRVMPGFAERAKKNKRDGEERRGATIGVVALNDCVIEVFDATVAGKPQKVRLEAVEGTVEDIRVPELNSRTRADLKGVVKGPNRMLGYLDDPDRTAEVIRDGWYITGDIASMDEDGFIRITDRLSRFSKLGGEMVPHIKIEESINDLLAEGHACGLQHGTNGGRRTDAHDLRRHANLRAGEDARLRRQSVRLGVVRRGHEHSACTVDDSRRIAARLYAAEG